MAQNSIRHRFRTKTCQRSMFALPKRQFARGCVLIWEAPDKKSGKKNQDLSNDKGNQLEHYSSSSRLSPLATLSPVGDILIPEMHYAVFGKKTLAERTGYNEAQALGKEDHGIVPDSSIVSAQAYYRNCRIVFHPRLNFMEPTINNCVVLSDTQTKS